jgi:hypothetical protein
MAQHPPVPEADRQEQLEPAGPEPPAEQLPVESRQPASHVPEADALEQALPADREILEDDE